MAALNTRVEISETRINGMQAFELRSSELLVTILPRLGGKITSLRYLPSGRQWLWQDPQRPLRAASYGDDFASYDLSGFDECFPSIGECHYPEVPFKGIPIPDHGEVWSLPWNAEPLPNGLKLVVHGVRFPYVFEKKVTLLPASRCEIEYKISNPAPVDFKCAWSAHPLFAVDSGMRIMLPGAPRLSQELCLAGGRLRPNDFLVPLRWPLVKGDDGTEFDLRDLPFDQLPVVDKVFATDLEAGWCAIWSPESGEYVGFAFDRTKVPFVGICVNLNPTPRQGPRALWTALEPCHASTDRLDISILRGHYRLIPAMAHAEWQLVLAAGKTAEFDGLAPDGSKL